MKKVILVLGLLIAGCDKPASPGEGVAAVQGGAADSGQPDGRILCAPPGEAAFRRVCAAERMTDAHGTVLTVRLPDGGFHRLRVSSDGRQVVAADGAMPATVRSAGGTIEVDVGGARYRLPAAAAGADAPG